MTDLEVTSTSEEGFVTQSRVGDFKLTVDATGEDGPDPNSVLIADYASCYIPAFRVAGKQRDYDDLGKVEIDVEADLDDDDDLTAIRFDIKVEADVDEDDVDDIVDRGHEICHVDAALRDDLRADVTVETNAF